MNEIVVARCNEDVQWVNNIQDWYYYVYNKGESYAGLPSYRLLNNIGREAHTYLEWIVEAISCSSPLPDEVVFCQGHPFDHDPAFIAHLSDDSVRHYGPVMDCTPDGGPHMGDGMLHEYCHVLGLPIQPSYRFVAGAQFRLRAEQITAHPLAFYEALLAITKIDHRSPYRLERLWGLIFGLVL